MKTTKIFLMLAVTGFLLTSCANDRMTENSNEEGQEQLQGTSFVGGIAIDANKQVGTRTSLDVTLPGGTTVDYFWEQGDNIWTDDGTHAEAQIAAKSATALFRFSKAYTTPQVSIYYPGQNATTYNQVTIAAEQTQTVPNSTTHLGTSGDCGTATAHKQLDGTYQFGLDHKAAYICLLPRSSNAYIQRSKIFKIEIISEDNIAGTYTLGTAGLTGAGSSKTITLTTGNGFDVTNTATNQSLNAAYAVIAPGMHNLVIRYWLRNTVDNPSGTIEGTVTKYFSGAFVANTVSPITANLDIANHSSKYYQFDAKKHYWDGFESVQPKVNGGHDEHYSGDYGDNTPPHAYEYTYSGEGKRGYSITLGYAEDLPTKNMPYFGDMTWYMRYGNPTYDEELFTVMGHLYKGRVLMKKSTVLQTEGHWNTTVNAYGKTKTSYDKWDIGYTFSDVGTGTFPSTISFPTSKTPLTYSDRDNYFALPFLGTYYHGTLEDVGIKGFYWTNSNQDAYEYMGAIPLEIFENEIKIIESRPRGYAMNEDGATMFK